MSYGIPWCYSFGRHPNKRKYSFIKYLTEKRNRGIAIALLVLLLGLSIPLLSTMYSSKQASAEGRKTIWKISLQMITQKPIFGFGYGLFERNYNLQQATYYENGKGNEEERSNASFVRMAYNEPLENAVEGGLIGMCLLEGIIIVLLLHPNYLTSRKHVPSLHLKDIKQKNKKVNYPPDENQMEYISAYAGVAAFAVMSLMNFTIQAIPVMALFMIYAAILTAKPFNELREEKILVPNKPFFSKISRASFGAILIVTAIILGISQVRYGIGHLKLKQEVVTLREGDLLKAEKTLEEISTQMNSSESYLQEHGKVYMAMKQYPLAMSQFKRATLFTSDPDLLIVMGQCYEQIGDTTEAEKSYRLAMNMIPGKFAPKYHLMKLYMKEKDQYGALSLAQSIIQLKPKIPSKEVKFYKKEAWALIQTNKAPSMKYNPFLKYPNLSL